MKRLPQALWLAFSSDGSPEAQLLAFTMGLRAFDLSRTRFWVQVPRHVFEAVSEDIFKEIFSDLLLEYDPSIAERMRVTVSSETRFGFGRLMPGEARPSDPD